MKEIRSKYPADALVLVVNTTFCRKINYTF